MNTRVFVVEDDGDIAAMVRRHLERAGSCSVATFARGARSFSRRGSPLVYGWSSV